MRTVWVAIVIAIGLSVFGFSAALLSAQPESEADAVMALERADNARAAFATAWNDWATQHDKFTISSADKERFKKVRKLWKEFDRLCRQIEY